APSLALADAAVPSDAKPARRPSPLCSAPRGYPQCGILGAPCCLGPNFLMPSPNGPEWTPLENVVRVLGDVAAIDEGEARAQLIKLRKIVSKKKAVKLEKLLSSDPRLTKLLQSP